MSSTTDEYRDAIYNKGDYALKARHVLPEVILDERDKAQANNTYVVSGGTAPESSMAPITTGVVPRNLNDDPYGTLEYQGFKLDGSKLVMPSLFWDYKSISSLISQELVTDDNPITVTVSDPDGETTYRGRTLFFDTGFPIPSDFKVDIYDATNTTIVATEQVTGNTKSKYVSKLSVLNAGKAVVTFTKMNGGPGRVRLVLDGPGVYYVFDATDIVSINTTNSVDPLLTSIIAGETDVMLRVEKTIFNEASLIEIDQLFDSKTALDVAYGLQLDDYMKYTTVFIGGIMDFKKDDEKALLTLTARDCLDDIVDTDWYKTPDEFTPLSEMLSKVATAAEVTVVGKSKKLRTMVDNYMGVLSSSSALKQILQAACLVPVASAYINIIDTKDAESILCAENIIQNSGFENPLKYDFNTAYATAYKGFWNSSSIYPVVRSDNKAIEGHNYLSLIGEASVRQAFNTPLVVGHKYFFSFKYRLEGTSIADSTVVKIQTGSTASTSAVTIFSTYVHTTTQNTWLTYSNTFTCSTASIGDEGYLIYIGGENTATYLYDAFTLIDLTDTYGEDEEPALTWCTNNIEYFEGACFVPSNVAEDSEVDDTLDLSILTAFPKITLSENIKAVNVDYTIPQSIDFDATYTTDTVYFKDTEIMTIILPYILSSATVQIYAATDTSMETPLSDIATVANTYPQAIELLAQATGKYIVKITGYKVNSITQTYTIENKLVQGNKSKNLRTINISNPFITNEYAAKDLAKYLMYWYNKRSMMDIQWRQNPKVHILDKVKVSTSEDSSTDICLTENNIAYVDGVLGGRSRGVS